MDANEYNELMNTQYELLKGLYFSNVIETNNYSLFMSSVITDMYWNILSLNRHYIFNTHELQKIETEFERIKRTPCICLPNVIDNYIEDREFLLLNGYKSNASDAAMFLENKTIPVEGKYDTKLLSTKSECIDFMEVLESAYSGDVSLDNPYAGAITKEYYIAIENSLNNPKFNHMILYYNGTPASIATLSYENGYGILNNVGTKKEYQGLGLGKHIVNACIEQFNYLGGGDLFLFTESESKNERWYTTLGFKTKFINEQFIKEI